MPHPRFGDKEIGRRGEEIYAKRLRSIVEIPDHIGKLLSIDIETGDFEIGSDEDIDAPLRLHAKHPGAAVYTLRIGYRAAVAIGGILERTG